MVFGRFSNFSLFYLMLNAMYDAYLQKKDHIFEAIYFLEAMLRRKVIPLAYTIDQFPMQLGIANKKVSD